MQKTKKTLKRAVYRGLQKRSTFFRDWQRLGRGCLVRRDFAAASGGTGIQRYPLDHCGSFDGHDKDWDAHNKRRMEFLKRHSEVIYASNISDAASFYKRDQYLVSQADCLIAVFDGDFAVKSSVERIVRGALKKDIPTVCIHPDTAEVFHQNQVK